MIGTREQVKRLRPRSQPVNRFQFGGQRLTTNVNMMTPKVAHAEYVDVTAAIDEQAIGKEVTFNILDSEATNDFH
jgi:hypothetical protein